MKTKTTLLAIAILTSISCNALNYFWVGGSGNWSDFNNHWATTSGGTIFHNQVPQSTDNVFFDAFSFTTSGQTVTIDLPIVQCADMTWTGLPTTTPTLAGDSSQTLRIHGSLVLLTGMAFNFNGQLIMEATTTGKTLSSGGTTINTSLTFNGAGGGWTLMDALKVTRVIYLNNGSLNTNNQTVNASAFYSNSASIRSLVMGASIFNLKGDINGIWNINPAGMTLNAGTSTINGTAGIGSDGSFYGGGLSYNNLSFASIAFIYGNNTFHDVAFISTGYINGNNYFHDVSFFVHAFINGNNTFNNVTMGGNATISSSNTFNNLSFSPWFTYTLQSGQTQTVGNICAQGTGALPIRIQASSAGIPAIISKASGTICWDYVRVSDITATGGAVFNAGLAPTNSQDLGGNTGLLFTGGCTAVSCLSSCTPPSITLNPIPVSVCGGSAASFTITATGTDLSYQWQVNPGAGFTNLINNSLYSGVTTNTLNITGATTVLNGNQYRCAAVGVCPLVSMSEAATLSVKPSPIVTVNSAAICAGQTAILTASIGSDLMGNVITGTETYAWSTGATTNSISVSPATSTNYTVTVTRNACSTTAIALVTVNPPPVVTVNSASICSGQTAVLTASAGTIFIPVPPAPGPAPVPPVGGAITYAWSNGATTSSISVSPLATTSYTVTVTSNGCSNTAIATVTVNPLPIVTASVSSSTVTVSAIGGTPPYTGTGIFTDLAPGTYSYTVTDANGCNGSTMVTVTEPTSTCMNAKAFDIGSRVYAAIENQTQQHQWFKFEAKNSQVSITLLSSGNSIGDIVDNIILWEGACANLSSISSDSITNPYDSVLQISTNGLTIGNTYYLVTNKSNSSDTTAFFISLNYKSLNTLSEYCEYPSSIDYCNAITNGGIEIALYAATTTNQVWYTCGWDKPTTGTPDYFSVGNAPVVGVPNNLAGNQMGNGNSNSYLGFVAYSSPDSPYPGYHEYVYQELPAPLIQGATYQVTFYVSLSDFSKYATNNIGAWLTTNANLTPFVNTPFQIPVIPQIMGSSYIDNCDSWTPVTQTYVANGTEEIIVIGNFGSNFIVSNSPCTIPSGQLNAASYYYLDDISMVLNISLTATPVSQTICSGETISAIAVTSDVAGSTFSWVRDNTSSLTGIAPSGTGSSISGTLTNTTNIQQVTTFTITATAPNGCKKITTVNVIVNPLPPAPTVTGSISACQLSGNIYTITNYNSSLTYIVSFLLPVNGSASTVDATGHFTVNWYSNNGGSVVVEATNSNGCTNSSQPFAVYPCCVYGLHTFVDGDNSASMFSAFPLSIPPTIANKQFSINGTFTVDQNMTWDNCDVRLGADAIINITNGANLTITSPNCHLYACNNMWKGIQIQPNSSLDITKRALVEDAKTAVLSINGGKYNLDAARLNKNYKHLELTAFQGIHPGKIKSSNFTCELIPQGTPTTLKPPYLGYRTSVGIDINNVDNVEIGTNAGTITSTFTNNFKNMNTGIHSNQSSITVYNNNFKDMSNLVSPNIGIAAIVAVGNPSSSNYVVRNLIVGDGATAGTNTFNNCVNGIVTIQNMNSTIKWNDFKNFNSAGVYITLNRKNNTVLIASNTFTNSLLYSSSKGIHCLYNVPSLTAIQFNDMNNMYRGTGVLLQEMNNMSTGAVYLVYDNRIRQTQYGVRAQNLSYANITNNYIETKQFYPAASPNSAIGIEVLGNFGTRVTSNNVKMFPQNSTNTKNGGIYASLSAKSTISCNTTANMGYGIKCAGPMQSDIFNNTIDNDFYGFWLDNSGFVGIQDGIGTAGFPSYNKWTSIPVPGYNAASKRTLTSNSTNGTLSPIVYKNNTGSIILNNLYYPYPTGILAAIPFTLTATTNGVPASPACTVVAFHRSSMLPHLLKSAQDIALDNINFPGNDANGKWLNKQGLLVNIKTDSIDVSSDGILQAFVNQSANDNLGKLTELNAIITDPAKNDTTDMIAAQALNAAISPNNAIETNQKLLNDIVINNYLSNTTSYTTAQINDLRLLANKCPFTDGLGVYQARVMLSGIDTLGTEYYNACETGDDETRMLYYTDITQNEDTTLMVYPNPASNQLTVNYRVASTDIAVFEIYNLIGEKVITQILNTNENEKTFSVVQLNSGAYFYKYCINGHIVKTNKLVMVK